MKGDNLSMKLFFITWGMIFFAALMDVYGAYVIKARINELEPVKYESIITVLKYLLELSKSPLVLFGAFLILTAPIPYALALSRMELSTAYPVIVGITALLLIPVAIFFLGESISWYKVIGIIIIIIGLYFIHK